MNSYLLILEDSGVLLDILKQWFRETFPDKPVLGVKSIAEAREAMAAVPIDFFLVDYSLPDGNGLDFIGKVRTTWPEARFILMTLEMPTAENKTLMALNPVSSFRKPIDLCELEWALRPHLDEKGGRPSCAEGAGFKTMVRGIHALDLIQLKCMEVATCALEFRDAAGEIGRIYLAKGEITHAETNRAIGIDALAEIIRWQDGAVQELSIWTPPSTVTIGPPWHSALMEAAQLADEGVPEAEVASVATGKGPHATHENLKHQ